MKFFMILASVAVIAAPLAAQVPDGTADSMRRRLDALLRIPQRVEDLRRAGVPDTAVRGVLDVLQREKVDPEQSEALIVAQTEAVREHGPTDNFGAFVQARLASGLRGRELADAIRAEHRAHGKGKPADAAAKGKARDDRGAKGKSTDDPGAKGRAPDSTGAKGKAPASRRPPR
jgi:hypothetical protein